MSALLSTLIDRIGFSTDLDTAAKILGYTGHKAARAAIARGSFPVPLRRAGSKILISTYDIAVFLSGGQAAEDPTPQPARRPGRPRGSTKASRQMAGVSHG